MPFLPSILRILSYMLLASPALAAGPVSTSCPAKAENLRKLTDSQIQSYCQKSSNARTTAEHFSNSYGSLTQCSSSLKMAREGANVIYATTERQKGFSPEVAAELTQKEAFETAAANLLKLHNFTNINLAAIYRSRLKLRQATGYNQNSLKSVKVDIDSAQRAVKSGEHTNIDPKGNTQLGQKQTQLKDLTGLDENLQLAGSCLDSMKAPLDSVFQNWSKVKTELLANIFEKYVQKNQQDSAAEAHDHAEAQRLQKEQQYVFDMLTNPAKRDWAYKIAEGCFEKHCDSWSPAASVVGFGVETATLASRTPVLGLAVKTISSGLAGDLAKRQGLTFWQQVKEAANAMIPFGLTLFDTEIGDIEKGRVKPFSK